MAGCGLPAMAVSGCAAGPPTRRGRSPPDAVDLGTVGGSAGNRLPSGPVRCNIVATISASAVPPPLPLEPAPGVAPAERSPLRLPNASTSSGFLVPIHASPVTASTHPGGGRPRASLVIEAMNFRYRRESCPPPVGAPACERPTSASSAPRSSGPSGAASAPAAITGRSSCRCTATGR